MILIKSGIGAKIAIGALGLVLGIGGIAAGAKFHAARTMNLANRRLFVGHITSVSGTSLTLHTASGATVTIQLVPRTVIRQRGHPVPTAQLQVGDRLVVRVYHTKTNIFYALFISIVQARSKAQGP